MEDLTKTRVFSSEDMRREMIRSNLLHTFRLIKMQEILFNKLKEMKLSKN